MKGQVVGKAREHSVFKRTSAVGNRGACGLIRNPCIGFANICAHLCPCPHLSSTSLPTASLSALLASLSLLVFQCSCPSGLSVHGSELLQFSFPEQSQLSQGNRSQICLPGSRQVHTTAFRTVSAWISHIQISKTQNNKNHTYSFSSSLKFASPSLSRQMAPPFKPLLREQSES